MGRLSFYKTIVGGLRQGGRAIDRLLSTVPVGWLIIMGILALPMAVLSVVVAIVFFILVVLLAVLGLLFYVLVLRPILGPRRRRDKVIEAEYTVKSEEEQ